MGNKASNKLSDQLRQAILAAPMSQYELAKRTGIDKSVLSRFLHGKGGLSVASIDLIGEHLGLRIVADEPRARKGK